MYNVLDWIIGIYFVVSFVALCFVPLLKNRKDESVQLRILSLILSALVVVILGHYIGLY